MDNGMGLRERKKAATRQALHEATLRLSLEHGFDHVTIEAIADEVGISRRTFFNYFGGKEDALLYRDEQQIQALVQSVRNRPAEEPAWTALRAAVHDMRDTLANPDRELAIRTRLAQQHPSLLARQLANHSALEDDLTLAVAEREHPPGVRPWVIAAAFLTSLRLAAQMWLKEESARPPADVMDEILDEMASSFTT
ncbi:TetR/AcrR family transcriptional regulator [Planomonospora corallina]|uniref:TetR/AcrR family transcriptional regulator n=1 Tax=Planomonospora corallina TaxID=1806052 RepID=A0ABV8ID89_9ACTN